MSEARKLLDSLTSEDQLLSNVAVYAARRGWIFYHPWKSYHSAAGFPDCTLIRPPRVIFAELKSMKGKMRPDQEIYKENLMACEGVEYYLWDPSHWSEIMEVLR